VVELARQQAVGDRKEWDRGSLGCDRCHHLDCVKGAPDGMGVGGGIEKAVLDDRGVAGAADGRVQPGLVTANHRGRLCGDTRPDRFRQGGDCAFRTSGLTALRLEHDLQIVLSLVGQPPDLENSLTGGIVKTNQAAAQPGRVVGGFAGVRIVRVQAETLNLVARVDRNGRRDIDPSAQCLDIVD